MVKVVKAATSVLAAHNQQQKSSGSTLASDDQTFAKKNLTLMSPADFTSEKVKPTLPPTLPKPRYTTPKRTIRFGNIVDSDSEDNTSVVPMPSVPDRKGRNPILALPKHLSYDGRTPWEPFFLKFTRYVQQGGWTEDEQLNCLVWCLNGKALEYYALIHDQEGYLTYQGLVAKLAARFGQHELPAAAHVRFQNAVQETSESLEEWADRVLTLGYRAFRKLPEEFVTAQTVNRFCQGMVD
jgi:hypothetical protein